MTEKQDQIKALANESRLEILHLLLRPGVHFGHQDSADPERFGVCVQLLAEHFEVSQPTMSRHVDVLKRAGFLRVKRTQKWSYCSRNEDALQDYALWLEHYIGLEQHLGLGKHNGSQKPDQAEEPFKPARARIRKGKWSI